MHRAGHVRDEIEARRIVPAQRLHGDRRIERCVTRLTRVCIDQIQVAAGRPEVAHDAADRGDAGSVGRPLRIVQLKSRRKEVAHRPGGDVDPRQPRDPPVVVAISFCVRHGNCAAVGRPAVFVDVRVGGREQTHRTGRNVDRREPLLVDNRPDDTDIARARRQRAGLTVRGGNIQDRQRLAVGRPCQPRDVTVEFADLAHVRSVGIGNAELRASLRARV